jgi:hypothetical protein
MLLFHVTSLYISSIIISMILLDVEDPQYQKFIVGFTVLQWVRFWYFAELISILVLYLFSAKDVVLVYVSFVITPVVAVVKFILYLILLYVLTFTTTYYYIYQQNLIVQTTIIISVGVNLFIFVAGGILMLKPKIQLE